MSGAFWLVEGRFAEISAQGDPLETLPATVAFKMFLRPILAKALGGKPRWKGGRPGTRAMRQALHLLEEQVRSGR